jgi:exonuclease SbcD
VRFRFVHAADLHLDTPFRGLRRVDPHVAATLADASLQAFDALVQLAVDRQAAFLLLGGDLYDGPQCGIRAQTVLRRGLDRLAGLGIATFAVLGNHDPAGADWSAIRTWPEGVTVFGDDRVQTVTVARDGQPIATIHGISYPRARTADNLARRFQRTGGPGIHIGLLHGDLGGDPAASKASPCSEEDLRAAGLDYWALGHRHAQRMSAQGGLWIVEPGTIQGRAPVAKERGAKGAVVVEVDDGVVQRPEFVALDRVRLEEVEVDVTGHADLREVVQVLQESGKERAGGAGDRSLILTATLVGGGPAAAELRRPGAPLTVLERLREEAGTGTPFLWWERVTDATRRDLDRAAQRLRADFPGEVLDSADRLAADPDALRAFADRHLAGMGAAAMAKALDGPVPDAVDPARWPRAVDLALDLLVEDR